MAGSRASIAAFVLSILGLTYQMFSLALAYYVNRQFASYYYVGIYTLIGGFSPLVGFWAASHLLDAQTPNRGVWPSMILALGWGA